MTTVNNLKLKQKMFNNEKFSGWAKAVQMGYLLRNAKNSKMNANAQSIYNNIIKKHYTNQNKFQFLVDIENHLNSNNVSPYIKHGFNTVDWTLVKTNPNYRALYNRVANKAQKKNIPLPGLVPNSWNIRTRPQQGGTCWFNAIINGLLLSQRPRALMKTLVADVPEIRVNENVCPSKKASRQWFLGYIKHRLQGPGPVHSVFKNINMIRASGLRGFFRKPGEAQFSIGSILNIPNTGGTAGDLIWFYNSFFPHEFTYRNGTSTPIFVMKKFAGKGVRTPEVPHELVRNGIEYELTHGMLTYMIKFPIGHAIAGYKSRNGQYYTFDSARDRPLYFDWTRATEVTPLAKIYANFGSSYRIRNFTVYAIYMRKNV